jgi:hypothetical protein
MQLHITSDEFRRLTPATQRELLMLLTGDDGSDDYLGTEEFEPPSAAIGSGADRRVVGITVEQTKELLSNLADKSQQTLRLFAQSERVEIDVLVGENMPYKDMNDLKRSFVGAVNRRLRTVRGDRGVVLFSSDRDRKRIRVLPVTASALRHVLGIESEPVGGEEVTDVEDSTHGPSTHWPQAE